ncbi:DUF58 domain-containing protein [Paenibacillus hexagrammi]|uniref:DUF58 domain-containing protein n=1 Tax=Paenibacillus hexagrammi TaxID=2908839 RepID=A0ABY3SMI3_9BACL|nr:DUF58 domain-containing protein [Paenibacillus sp. YPD9-1]UJF35103.1 DUF58 domain-containing protein [Paenibacillus sp. YPD9-1]
MEFADYRLYTPGDDPRRLDWHVYGRTGRPFIKLFMDEQELHVHVWLDASKSMDFGGYSYSYSSQAPLTKWDYARQLAAAIGYISLSRYDRVSVSTFVDTITGQVKQLRGKGSVPRLFEFLETVETNGEGDIGAVFKYSGQLYRQPGMTWLFSDFMYEAGVKESLKYLLAARQEVVVVQILTPEEITPSLTGELKLIDSESGQSKEVAMTERVLQSYRLAVEEHTLDLKAFCHEHGIACFLAVTDTDPVAWLWNELQSSGLIR